MGFLDNILKDPTAAVGAALGITPTGIPLIQGVTGGRPIDEILGGKGGQQVSYQGVPLPVLADRDPELYKQILLQNPELQTAEQLGPSAMQGISLDPAQRQAQLKALQKFQEISDAGGRDAQFLSESNRLQNDVNANLQGQQGAIQQNLATRGLSGGMSELVQKQLAAQQGANRQAQMGLDLNAQAQQRALQALQSGAQLGGQMNEQQFGQQAQVANAADAISRFNAQNRQNVQAANVGTKNQFNVANTDTANRMGMGNVDLKNAAKEYNTGGKQQQQFQNATGQAQQQYQADLNNQQLEEQKKKAKLGLIGGAISTGAQAFGGK